MVDFAKFGNLQRSFNNCEVTDGPLADHFDTFVTADSGLCAWAVELCGKLPYSTSYPAFLTQRLIAKETSAVPQTTLSRWRSSELIKYKYRASGTKKKKANTIIKCL